MIYCFGHIVKHYVSKIIAFLNVAVPELHNASRTNWLILRREHWHGCDHEEFIQKFCSHDLTVNWNPSEHHLQQLKSHHNFILITYFSFRSNRKIPWRYWQMWRILREKSVINNFLRSTSNKDIGFVEEFRSTFLICRSFSSETVSRRRIMAC